MPVAHVKRHLGSAGPEAEEHNEAIRGGSTWLADRSMPTTTSQWYFYHAQALERAANLLQVGRIGDHNWRAELTAEMLRRRQPDGSFDAISKIEAPLIATCFALMTLSGHPADIPGTANGLEFLKPYPKLYGLSLDMTENEFVEIVEQQDLTTKKTNEDGEVQYHVAFGDDHTLIVIFDMDGKCIGIQRVRGDESE